MSNFEKELFEHLKNFMLKNDWQEENTPEQARAMFTAICIIGDIEADTLQCDNMLLTLYNESAIESVMSYEEFENFMVALIV